MALPKNHAFLGPEVRLAAYAKALSHPARIAILKALAERGECVCGELVGELPLAQATVSQHLRALKEAGLVTLTTDGPRSCYALDPDGFAELRRHARYLFFQLQQGVDEQA
ncbi:MAG: metalloregulator ArsR/SmtB family transcription factor [Bacteroidota bacterium]